MTMFAIQTSLVCESQDHIPILSVEAPSAKAFKKFCQGWDGESFYVNGEQSDWPYEADPNLICSGLDHRFLEVIQIEEHIDDTENTGQAS